MPYIPMETLIRPAREEDVDTVLRLFDAARAFMRSRGNTRQWIDGYPSAEHVRGDIGRGEGYVVTDGLTGDVLAYFCLMLRPEPTYADILGAWLDDTPYGTIHRAASAGSPKGVFDIMVKYALTRIGTLRVDTHRDNLSMQRALERNGFHYCGIIHLASGDERLAYERPGEA